LQFPFPLSPQAMYELREMQTHVTDLTIQKKLLSISSLYAPLAHHTGMRWESIGSKMETDRRLCLWQK
jgi:hypothetical protein